MHALKQDRGQAFAAVVQPPVWKVLEGGMPPLPDGLLALQAIGTRVGFGRGETIFNEGDRAEKLYRLLSGAVRLCKHMADGRRQIIDFAVAGEFFGLMPVDEYAFAAEALNEVVVVSYPRRQIERLKEECRPVRAEFGAMVTARMLGMHDHLVMLGRQTAKERLSAFLFKLAERAEACDGDRLELPMSRQDIADYLGLTIETVCRELSNLKREMIVATPDLHSVMLHDTEALERIAFAEE